MSEEHPIAADLRGAAKVLADAAGFDRTVPELIKTADEVQSMADRITDLEQQLKEFVWLEGTDEGQLYSTKMESRVSDLEQQLEAATKWFDVRKGQVPSEEDFPVIIQSLNEDCHIADYPMGDDGDWHTTDCKYRFTKDYPFWQPINRR